MKKQFLNPSSLQRTGWLALFMLLALSLFGARRPVLAQSSAEDLILMPMGGGYTDVYPGWSELVVTRAKEGRVKILVLPTTYSTSAEKISDGERQVNMRDADVRRYEVEQSCQRNAPQGVTCTAVTLPVFTRQDALEIALEDYFTDDLTAVFILGGDQTVAMLAIANTPVEQALQEAYQRGVIVGGTSAGGGMLARDMLAGYRPNFSADNSLDFGAAEMWITVEKHGLSFSVQGAVLDQHFYQRARLGRLLNAISLPGSPAVGIGIDAYTGMRVTNGTRISDLYGLYTVTILDAATYHAAEGVQYRGEKNTLSLRNVLVHLLSPGSVSYDLSTRSLSLAAWQPRIERQFEGIQLPAGAGPLWLGGNLNAAWQDHPALRSFVQAAGGAQANILVIATGYPSERSANSAAQKVIAALGVTAQALEIKEIDSAVVEVPAGVTGIVVIGRDQSKLGPGPLQGVRAAWLAGIPVLMDDAAAPLAGGYYSAHGPTSADADEAELATQKSFWQGRTKIEAGLGMLNATFEPQILNDNRWGRLYSLAFNHSDLVCFGLMQDTVLEIDTEGARVVGGNAIFALDLRGAVLELGSNEGFVFANGLMDVFAAGDEVRPEIADANAVPQREPTPDISALLATATLSPTATPVPPTLTSQPSPTATATKISAATAQVTIPAPQQQVNNTDGLIIAAILVMVVIIMGVGS
ncbi:MAG TPA: hypothetical protein VFF78_04840, partial [Anaerolineaceae bacterium]|nr:hypothetical protein [Anaerolineaceae bacterium]